MKTKKKKKITKLESILFKTGITIIILLVIAVLVGETSIAKINLEVQELKKQVEKAKDQNTGLTMKINEMASLSNVEEVSKEEGLTYNSDNIKTIK